MDAAALIPSDVRYIKLGPGGRWVDPSLESGEIRFAYCSLSAIRRPPS
jgi:hypothetical protein